MLESGLNGGNTNEAMITWAVLNTAGVVDWTVDVVDGSGQRNKKAYDNELGATRPKADVDRLYIF